MNPTFEGLLKFVEQNDLVKIGMLSEIRKIAPDSRPSLCIDGNLVLQKLTTFMQQTEPLWCLTAATPTQATLDKFFNIFFKPLTDASVDVVVVCDGLPATTDPLMLCGHVPSAQCKFTGWQALDGDLSVKSLRPDIAREVREHFHFSALDEDGESFFTRMLAFYYQIETCRAPYWSWNQMAAFLSPTNLHVGDVMGPIELLAYEHVSRVVLNVDLQRGIFQYVEKEAVLNKLKNEGGLPEMTGEYFTNAVVMCSDHPRFKEFNESFEKGQYGSFVELTRAAMQSGNFAGFIRDSAGEYGANVRDIFLRLLAMVKFGPVLTCEADCIQLSKLCLGTAPCNMRAILGCRLPSIFYYFMYSHVISPQVLAVVAAQRFVDYPPIAETREYKQVSEKIIPLRTQVVFQLVQSLAEMEQFYSRDFNIIWRRVPSTLHLRNTDVPILRPPAIQLDEWQGVDVSDEHDETHMHNFGSVTQFANNAKQTYSYRNFSEVFAAIHLKSLDLLGYFTHATHSNQDEVSGKSVYCEALDMCAPGWSEAGVLLIELLRTKSLTDLPYTFVVGAQQLPVEMVGLNFASRLLSLMPITVKQAWTGPVNAGLLAFNSIVRSLNRTLHSLTQVLAVTLFLANSRTLSTDDYRMLPVFLPFQMPPTLYAGIIIRFIMLRLPQNTADAWASLHTTFPECDHLEEELLAVFIFWQSARSVVNSLLNDEAQQNMLDSSVAAALLNADLILTQRAQVLFPQQRWDSMNQPGDQTL